MIKKLLTIASVVFSVAVNAQNGKVSQNTRSEFMPAGYSTEKTAVVTCPTISVINPTANVSRYTASTSTACPTGGYVFGNNCYGYTEIATFFNSTTYSTVTSPSITAVAVGFYRNSTGNTGTKGTTGTVGMKIYGGTNNTTAPGASAITSTTATLANIVAAQTGTSTLFVYTFTFVPTGIPSTGFYASVVLPTNVGDTAAIYTQTATASTVSPVNNAWGKDATTWADATSDWGVAVNHVMLPVVCGNSVVATGISQNLGLSKEVRVMPNPSNGIVNVLVTLGQTENVSVTVTNALGQQIVANKYDGISNEIISLDLTNQSNGVYFVTVSNGRDKMVQRLILSK